MVFAVRNHQTIRNGVDSVMSTTGVASASSSRLAKFMAATGMVVIVMAALNADAGEKRTYNDVQLRALYSVPVCLLPTDLDKWFNLYHANRMDLAQQLECRLVNKGDHLIKIDSIYDGPFEVVWEGGGVQYTGWTKREFVGNERVYAMYAECKENDKVCYDRIDQEFEFKY